MPSVTEADPKALAWTALADELTPAKSLARIDTATNRVVTNVTVVGTALTGLGVLTAGLTTIQGAARGLAIAAVADAVTAVACALIAQILTIRTNLNTRNIPVLKSWYRQQFRRRAYPTRAATILLILAILLAGAASATALTQSEPKRPTIAITQSTTTLSNGPDSLSKTAITIDVTFRDLDAADTLILIVKAGNAVVAQAAAIPQPDGTATRAITIPGITANTPIGVIAAASKQTCTATLNPGRDNRPQISCRL